MLKVVVTGAGGFIGSHLVKYLRERGYWVRGIDIKKPEFAETKADEFVIRDLRYPAIDLFEGIDEVYHLAADMGGIGYIENNKCAIVFNNTMIDMLTLKVCQETGVKKFLYTSSACIYPAHLQDSPKAQFLTESDAYPADAEDGYGWQKLMTERACRHFQEDCGMEVHIARFHNIYGPLGTYQGGREKSPAALCRKIAVAKFDTPIEIWGDGLQTRSYCYIDDCVEALYRLMQSKHSDPINIGTDELISINDLVTMIEGIACKKLIKAHDLTKPQGVRGRNADISKAKEVLGWEPQVKLNVGMDRLYRWIFRQIYP